MVQPIFQHVELQYAHHADNDLLHTGIVLLEDLNRAFLGDLFDPFHKLFSFHGVHLTHPGEMFRRESRDAFILDPAPRHAHRISYRKYTRIKKSDNVSRIGLFHNLAVLGHHLLRLGQPDLFVVLHVQHFHARLKFAGTDTHKRDAVPVRLIHIGLNLEDKSGKSLFYGIDHAHIRFSGQRGRGHRQEML